MAQCYILKVCRGGPTRLPDGAIGSYSIPPFLMILRIRGINDIMLLTFARDVASTPKNKDNRAPS